MISFGGARKTVDVGAIERIKGWAAASLAGSSAFDADATLKREGVPAPLQA